MARRSRGQFQFTIFELSVLAASFTATSVLVFLLGLYVGRDLASEHAPVDARIARIPVSDVLPRPPVEASDADGSEVQPAAAAKGAPAARTVAPRSPEDAAAARRRQAAAEAEAAALEARREAERRAIAAERERAGVPPVPPQRATGAARQPAGGRPDPVLALPVEPEPQPQPGVAYTVQVLATRDRSEAEALVADLKRRGFGAFVASVEDAGSQWYRVRIGRYDSQRSARSMAERCRSQLGLRQAFVSPYGSPGQ